MFSSRTAAYVYLIAVGPWHNGFIDTSISFDYFEEITFEGKHTIAPHHAEGLVNPKVLAKKW
jgi:hypothetical protein